MEFGTIREQLALLHNSAFGWAMVCCRRDRDLAADVLQQAYCRILAGEATFAGRSEFATWVFGVIRHTAYEEVRRRARDCRHTRPIGHDLAETELAETDFAGIEQREVAEQLAVALAQLSQRQREVLHLTFYEGLTIEQAAGVLQVGVGSARQHYQRGKAALKRLLAASPDYS